MRKLIAFVLLVAGCATVPPVVPGPDWRVFHARGPYTVRIPPDMVEVAMTPIDSAADHLTSEGLRFNLDYGRYGCGVLHRNPGERHRPSSSRVDGRPVEIDRYTAEPNEIGEFAERLYAQIPEADGNCLAVHAMCRTGRDCDVAHAMVRTIDFDPQG